MSNHREEWKSLLKESGFITTSDSQVDEIVNALLDESCSVKTLMLIAQLKSEEAVIEKLASYGALKAVKLRTNDEQNSKVHSELRSQIAIAVLNRIKTGSSATNAEEPSTKRICLGICLDNMAKWTPITRSNWPPQNWPQSLEQNRVYSIPYLDIAHLAPSIMPEKPLLFRPETLGLFRSLSMWRNHQPKQATPPEYKCKGVIVEGPPGIGKSCTTWAWALSQMTFVKSSQATSQDDIANPDQSRDRSLLWIHIIHETAYFVRITENEISEIIFDLTSPSELVFAKKLIAEAREDIVVLDGLLGDRANHIALTESLESRCQKFHVQVASLAFNRSNSRTDALETEERSIKILEMYPWTLEDYKLACTDDKFYNSVSGFLIEHDDIKALVNQATAVDRDEVLSKKYYFAGSCARFMFAKTFDQVKNKINDMIRKISDPNAHMRLLCGDKPNQSTNGLVVRRQANSNLFYVSKYAAMQLSDKCSHQVFSMLYETSNRLDNPTFKGWVLEMEMAHACNKPELNL